MSNIVTTPRPPQQVALGEGFRAILLNWPDYKVLQVSELEHDYQVHAEISEPPSHCPHCNHPEIVGFGRRDEVIMDTPVHGKRTVIILNRRRYRCQSPKTFLEPIPHKDNRRQMTTQLLCVAQ